MFFSNSMLYVLAQQQISSDVLLIDSSINFLFKDAKLVQTDSGKIIIVVRVSNCKGVLSNSVFMLKKMDYNNVVFQKIPNKVNEEKQTKNIIVHGNISYDFFYRSSIDTTFLQREFKQHTERVFLNVLLKNKFPITVNFTARQSNSPFFQNFNDINFGFDRNTFTRNLKQKLIENIKNTVPLVDFNKVMQTEVKLREHQLALQQIREWLSNPKHIQKLVQEKEALLVRKAKEKGDSIAAALQKSEDIHSQQSKAQTFKDAEANKSFNIDSSKKQSFLKTYESQKEKADSLLIKIEKGSKKLDSLKNKLQQTEAILRKEIAGATNIAQLKKVSKKYGISTKKQSWLEEKAAGIKTLGIGRSMLNYTELTAQNITVTGVNVEYNSKNYIAFAAGKIDYRFRDFYNRNSRQNNQHIVLGRLGFGDIEKRAVIFTYFTGRKNDNGFATTSNETATTNLMGYAIETIIKKNENSFLSAEFAKSTKPIVGGAPANKQAAALSKFSDETNMGINVKAQTTIEATKTKLSGFLRKTGENFQSFSLFTYNTNQTAWLARADQNIYKERIVLTGMLRRNDFANPFVNQTYKTSTIFKSALLNVRIPQWPTLNMGYYPSTQLYIVNNETLRESAYYVFNASSSYSTAIKDKQLNTVVVYNKLNSEATDSGFVPFKGINFSFSQSMRIKNVQLQVGYALTKQPILQFSTLESMAEYSVKSWLQLAMGIKLNKVSGGDKVMFGQNAQMRLELGKLGGLHFQYEKSFLPTIQQQQLAPVEIGRVGFYKRF
jgi:hypothetical protein